VKGLAGYLGVALACAVWMQAGEARADGCASSRDHILAGIAEDLPRRPRAYQELYRTCLRTLLLSNVKDAFVLKAGAIAVLPRIDSVPATAGTLAQFCTQFPRETLRFITRRETRMTNNIARIVQLGISESKPCPKITGSG